MEWLQKAGDLLDKLDKTAAEQLNAHDEDAEVRAPCHPTGWLNHDFDMCATYSIASANSVVSPHTVATVLDPLTLHIFLE